MGAVGGGCNSTVDLDRTGAGSPLFFIRSFVDSRALPGPALAGRQERDALSLSIRQGDPCHFVKGCPDADASSVLSLDSITAPFRKHQPKCCLLSSS